MKIGLKLSLGFIGLTSLIVAISFVSLQTSQECLEKAIGKNSADFAEQVIGSINGKVQRRIEDIQALATNDMLRQMTAQSNTQFENLDNPADYVEQIECDWTNKGSQATPVMVQLSTNKLAERLKTLKEFYRNKYGFPVFSEILVTNKFGANVAQSNKTTDYYQADEEWWQEAKINGTFTSEAKYDDSSNTNSIDIAARIENAAGEFLGVIKAVLNLQETDVIINEAKTASEYKTIQLHLINKDGKIICSTRGYSFGQDAHGLPGISFGQTGRPEQKRYFIGQQGSEKELLFTNAISRGYDDFKGMDWILLTETSTAEIFAPLFLLKKTMLLAGIVVLGLALLACAVTYRSIIIPIAALKNATIQITAGNLDANLTTASNDEIGQLAGSFQKMAHQLKKTITDLNVEISERKKSGEKLRDNQRFLDNIFDSIQDGIGIMDNNFNILKVNTWMENTHPDAMPLIGKKCYEAYHKRDSECPGCPSALTLKTGKPYTVVIPNPCKRTRAEWIELSTFPLKDHNGNITGVIEYLKDVTKRIKTENSLKKSEERFSQVVENARECVWETDTNGIYTYISPVIKEVLGYNPEELIGKRYYDLVHPDDLEKIQTAFSGILTSRLPFQKLVNRNIHKNGDIVWLSTSAMPICDEQGKVVGFRGVDADITEQRKAEQILSERAEQIMQHHNTLLKLANMPEQDIDSLLRITTEQDAEVLNVERVGVWFFNKQRSEIVCRDVFIRSQKEHRSGDSLRAQDYPIYFKALENSRIMAVNNTSTDPRAREFDDTYSQPKGITSMMDVPIRLHGQIVGIICHEHTGAVREWTSSEQDFAASAADMISLKLEAAERRKAEQALEKLNKELEATIGELSRSNGQLQDFVHIAAHDLKTPVRGIGTLADWIVSDYGDKLDAKGREQVRLLKTRVMRINKLIDGMLQFSKIVRTRNKEKRMNLNDLLTQIIKDIKVPENIEIAVDSLPEVTCECEHITQLFQILVSNAIAFMDKPKGLIKVGCVEQNQFWKFHVSDNGPGIEQKHYERIFRIFQTLPKKDEPETAGTGLAVAKKIVELYGGRIWVESQPNTGSTFFFTFPAQQEESAYANAKTSTAY